MLIPQSYLQVSLLLTFQYRKISEKQLQVQDWITLDLDLTFRIWISIHFTGIINLRISITIWNEVIGTKFFYPWYFNNYRGQKTQIREECILITQMLETVIFIVPDIFFCPELARDRKKISGKIMLLDTVYFRFEISISSY